MNVVEHNSGTRRTAVCGECEDLQQTLEDLATHMTQKHDRDAAVETGEIYAKSPLTGVFYRVTEWVVMDGDKIQARSKEEVDREAVPDEWLVRLGCNDVNGVEQADSDANSGEHA